MSLNGPVMRKIIVTSTSKVFERSVVSAFRIYAPLRSNCIWDYDSINDGPFHPRVASKIVGLAFLSMVSAWEEFAEQLFYRYMIGGATESGYAPKLRLGPCDSIRHAIEVLSGSSRHSDRFGKWNDFAWVLEKASIFFVKGTPFSAVPTLFRERLSDAQIVRNRVAHSSAKARAQFRRLANRTMGSAEDSRLPRGFSPGRLLIWNQPRNVFGKDWVDSHDHDFDWDDMFECYTAMFLELADILAPANAKRCIADRA